MNKPKVTIMIPTYNQSQFIQDAVWSALQQTYENLEVVVGDDASTDDTRRIIRTFDDPRLKYVRHRENLGRVGNYRKLLYEHVSGDYVVNLDGDDYYTDSDFITLAVDLILETDSVPLMVVARASSETTEGKILSDIPACRSISGVELLKKLPCAEYSFKHMAVLYSVPDAKQQDFYRSPAISSDWESLYRLAAQGTIVYLDRNVGVWRKHDRNQTGDVDMRLALENLGIWRAVYENAAMQGLNSVVAYAKRFQCEAFFALRYLVQFSKQGNRFLLRFLGRFVITYPLGSVCLIGNPRAVRRILQSLGGMDRRNSVLS